MPMSASGGDEVEVSMIWSETNPTKGWARGRAAFRRPRRIETDTRVTLTPRVPDEVTRHAGIATGGQQKEVERTNALTLVGECHTRLLRDAGGVRECLQERGGRGLDEANMPRQSACQAGRWRAVGVTHDFSSRRCAGVEVVQGHHGDHEVARR